LEVTRGCRGLYSLTDQSMSGRVTTGTMRLWHATVHVDRIKSRAMSDV
jgi:hypothetical protein